MARSNYPSDRQDQFIIRLPDGMRDRLKAAAASNNRSMNAEVVARLENSEQSRDDRVEALLREILERLEP